MTATVQADGSERFTTGGGITITRRRTETPYEGAIEAYVSALDSRRGALFSSNYEFPGRYTRWDTAIIDPPLVVSARGRAMSVEALNSRGEVMLPAILAVLGQTRDVEVTGSEPRKLSLKVAEPRASLPRRSARA